MFNVVLLDAFFHITIGSRPVIARTRAAADQNKCFKDFRMIKTELKSNVAADADTRNDGFLQFFFARQTPMTSSAIMARLVFDVGLSE